MTFHRALIALLRSISSGLPIDYSSFEVEPHDLGATEYPSQPAQEDTIAEEPSGCDAQHDLAALMRLTPEHLVCCAGLFQREHSSLRS